MNKQTIVINAELNLIIQVIESSQAPQRVQQAEAAKAALARMDVNGAGQLIG